MWYHKYSLKELTEFVMDSDYKSYFQSCLDKNEIPHLLFYGPQGSGKTSLAKVLIDKIPGKQLILNASSKERGIDYMKNQVTNFAASMTKKGECNLVLIDEGEGLTRDAQEALKGIFDKYSETCRFILTTNNINRIIEPLQSRCQCFSFTQFHKRAYIKRCRDILNSENIQYDMEELKKVVDATFPDMRSTCNALEYGSTSGTLIFKDKEAFEIDVVEIERYMEQGDLTSILQCLDGKKNFDHVYRWLMHEYIPKKSVDNHGNCVLMVSEWMRDSNKVVDETVHLMGCLVEIMMEVGVKCEFRD